jgi:DNA-binding NarL/FixJ family response regulator
MRVAARLWEHQSAMTPIRVLCVDDHPLLREGIAAVIGNQQDMVMVGEASTGREALERFCALHPDVVLMDLHMPEMSGIDAIVAIRSAVPNARIVVLKSVAAGNSNRIVGDKLVIAEETVKNHLRSILSKLSANDRTHAVTIALKRGIIDV